MYLLKKYLVLFSVIFTFVVLIFGYQHYNAELRETKNKALAAYEISVAEEEERLAKEEEARKKEEQAIYNEHKGQTLLYSPMGDSITVGGYATSEDKTYVSLVTKLIEEKLGYDVKVQEGVMKAGTGLVDYGIPNVSTLIDQEPDFVTIGYGTNDINEALNAYSTPEEFEERLNTLIDTINKESHKKPKIVLITTWKNGDKSFEYDAIIKRIGKEQGIPVADISTVWQNRNDTVGPAEIETPFGISDIWHPNDQGHKEIADKVFKQAYEILK